MLSVYPHGILAATHSFPWTVATALSMVPDPGFCWYCCSHSVRKRTWEAVQRTVP
jgi:hypothetical protein